MIEKLQRQRQFHTASKIKKIILTLSLIILTCYSGFSQVSISSTNYTTLKAAFDAINAGVWTGTINVFITSNTTETATALLYASNVNVTIRPSGGDRTISGSVAGNLVEIQSSNVTIDGSTTVGGTSRNLSITNSNTSTSPVATSVAFALGSNCTVKNCNIYCQSTGVGYAVILLNAQSPTIQNCAITKCDVGIFAQSHPSYTTGYPSRNVVVKQCTIGSSSSNDKIRWRGIMFGTTNSTALQENVDGFTISDNEILGINNSSYTGQSAIAIALLNGAKSGTVSRNKIHDIKSTASSGAYGIYAGFSFGQTAPTTGDITFDNNFIYDVLTTTSNTIGIVAGYLTGFKFYHNTIYLASTSSTTATSCCLWINPYSSGHYCKNNIFKNTVQATGGFYALGMLVNIYNSASPFTELDYNDYYVAASGTNNLGYYNGVSYNTLSTWQTAVGAEKYGQNVDPTFTSTDLHLDGNSLGNSNLKCPVVSGFNLDIDNETRVTGSGNTTYMGADEVIPNLVISQNINQLPSPICEGSGFSFTWSTSVRFSDNVARSATPTYEWYKQPSTTPLTGLVSNTMTKTASVLLDAGTYYSKASFMGLSVTSNTSTVTIHTPVRIAVQPNTYYYICAGFPFDYPPEVVGGGTVTGYQWQKENPQTKLFTDMPGQTASKLNVSSDQATGRYRVKVFGGVCNNPSIPVVSEITEVVVSFPLKNVMMSYDPGFDPGLVCEGSQIKMTAYAEGTILGYQWEKMEEGVFVPISGNSNKTANDPVFIIDNAGPSATGTYRCKVSGSANCLTGAVYTNNAVVKVWKKFVFDAQPEPQILCKGANFQLNIVAVGEIQKLRWQKDGVDIDPATNPSAKDPVLNVNNVDYKVSGAYRCVATVKDCRGVVDVPSDEALVYVLTPPEITRQPESQIGEDGGTVMFQVQAHVYNTGKPVERLDYQWYMGDLNTPIQDDEHFAGARSSILSVTKLRPSDFRNDYFVVVTGVCGSTQSENCGILTPPDLNITSNPPATQSVCEGQDAVFNVTAEIVGGGKQLLYQWFKDGVELADGANISGATTSSLKISGISPADAGKFKCKVTVIPGNKNKETTESELTVLLKPAITQQPEASTDVQAGRSLSLYVDASGSSPLQYQWYKDGNELAGEVSATFTVPSATISDAGTYKCKVANSCGEIFSTDAVVNVTMFNTTGISDVINNGFGLFTNVPNPVTGSAVISFMVPSEHKVRITITDMFGREVGEIYNGTASAGKHDVIFNVSVLNLPSGVYNYTMESAGFVGTKQMIILK